MKPCAVITAIILLAMGVKAGAAEEQAGNRYIFSWPFIDTSDMAPRGGTTEGPDVTLLTESSAAFERLQEPELSKLERDRRAILAMAGSYRVGFDFLEVIGYAPAFEPARPYRSWATEHVKVIEDGEERISLQHILVMSFVGEDGEVQGPFVTKHWRQDWTWQAASAHVYRGFNRWVRETRGEAERQGQWLQTVWQVDDSPRYAAWGSWEHSGERSTWLSGGTWRPLPRREFSVRDDYDTLIGTNRHTVLPTGWVQKEDNVKTVLEEPGRIDGRLAREIGIARYERITDLDTAAADAYWQETGDFWALVRDYWDSAMADNEGIGLKADVDGQQLFEVLFDRAAAIEQGQSFSEADNRRFVNETLDAFRSGDSAEAGNY